MFFYLKKANHIAVCPPFTIGRRLPKQEQTPLNKYRGYL